eukprot:c17765_g1_i2.p1 GENE.c17765_g1_i2~~c17765_g1_i2.p1  ORF type:complete len:282 (+),score=58.69 c17765_g1_i2:667-1512(+)
MSAVEPAASAPPPALNAKPKKLRVSAKSFNLNRKIYHDTDLESSGSKFARCLKFDCLGQKSVVSSENVVVEEFVACSRVTRSMDVDLIDDIQLRETCGVCLCLCGKGDIRIYGADADQTNDYFTLFNVENAAQVFSELGELVSKLNDLRYGLKRPDDQTIPFVIYNSHDDGSHIKLMRCLLFGCLRPHTVITKSGVTQSQWQGVERVTKRMDMDVIKDLSMSQNLCDLCCTTGRIRIFGQDKDQTDDFFDVTWIDNVKQKFSHLDNYHAMLNNRERIGFKR